MNEVENDTLELILPFEEIDRSALPVAGGKAANLGELVRAGLPVPAGFCITTAAYEIVAADAGLEPTLTALAGTPPEDTQRLAGLAAEARSSLLEASVPDVLAQAISEAYGELGDGEPVPVAVRSSATAEDLPYASFAGQQDTYLNVVGVESVLDAVRRCWASLWTDRAVSYRATNGIDPHGVRLAVAVQRMVDASVAGVLFTANPVTGKRRQAVIDASPGLGEAVVSGMVNPDHFVVDTARGKVVERRLGDKRVAVRAAAGSGTERVEMAASEEEASLSDPRILALAKLGARVEEYYGSPQDTEWAIDGDGKTWLLQARPITTLFPLPANAPTNDEDLRVYFSFSVAQGVYRPLTPMGIQAFRLIVSAVATLAGGSPRNPYDGPAFFVESAGRIFADVTPVLRSKQGRGLFNLVLRNMEARAVPIVRELVEDPRLAPVSTSWRPILRALLPVLVRTRIPLRVVQALARPEKARARAARVVARFRAADDVRPDASVAEHLAAAERWLSSGPPGMLPAVPPAFIAGLGANALAGKLLGDLATDDERRVAMRALPHNPTTEMDLALWDLARDARADPDTARTLTETPPERLAEDYLSGSLPPKLQTSLADFLRLYGHRGVAEIDLGLPRWSEDPMYILGVLANYLRLVDPESAPDVQFKRATREAEEMVAELTRRAARKGRLRGGLVGFLLGRARELSGLREMPKFCIVLLMARARELLWKVGEDLAGAGRLENAEDIFFVSVPEAWAGLAGEDLRPIVRGRRGVYEQEIGRKHVPRLLLSDGTEPTAETHSAAEGVLLGTPASGGVVTEKARVILYPGGARLEPGEILVAPSTDPGWTPLFLTAGGLVMEMGGPMSHGAIVAREYGIPAVVGVPDATDLINTGERITVDGAAGEITPEAADAT
jgi:phosphohistidine swiveling domain-containing protein